MSNLTREQVIQTVKDIKNRYGRYDAILDDHLKKLEDNDTTQRVRIEEAERRLKIYGGLIEAVARSQNTKQFYEQWAASILQHEKEQAHAVQEERHE